MESLRAIKRGVKEGTWSLRRDTVKVSAKTKFQVGRMESATAIAKAYLTEDVTSGEIAKMLGVTRQRGQQIINEGVKYFLESGWLREKRSGRRG
jgi:DNA-directed RNA polymerase specialized sigma subunit